ncbi:MAG TPA: hypothetical protein VGG91_02110, partial [Myxococcaceae bacterium]
MTESHWIPGIVVLSLGLIAGALYLLFGRKSAVAIPAEQESDAQRRVDSLLSQLREHQGEQHQMDPTAWEAERTRLERAAADAMRARDALGKQPEKAAARGKKGAATA